MLPTLSLSIPEALQKPPRDLLVRFLNQLFSDALADGEVDFLYQKVLRVVLTGTNVSFNLTLLDSRLRASPGIGHWDLQISGRPNDFILLAARTVDADTLFFQRRLKIEGSTELGLYLKNFLDAQDLSELPYAHLLSTALSKLNGLHEGLTPALRLPHRR